MSIYTEEAERRSKPAVVAECWTCCFYEVPIADGGKPFGLRLTEEADIVHHRAAGHDVRPVKSNR